MKLRCIKKHPVIIQEYAYQKVSFGDIIDGKDATYAEFLMQKYPTCFEKFIEEPSEKQIKSYKNKMAPKNESEKEFW